MVDEHKSAVGRTGECLPNEVEKEAYREKAARLQAILDATVDGIISINEHRIVQSFNKAAETIFGYRADEVIEKNVNMLMPSPYHEEHDSYVNNYLRTGNPKVIGIGREVSGRRKDGSTFPLYLAVGEVLVGDRRLFTGIVRDISEKKKAEEELRKAKDELEESVRQRTAQLSASNVRLERINRDLQEFLFAASNDLQEPLRKIQILNDRIKSGYCKPLDEKGKQNLEKMQSEAKRMQDRIQALLEYSRIATKAGPFVTIDLNLAIQEVIRELAVYIKRTGARVETGDLPVIEADPGQIHLLLQNLVENALKFRGAEAPILKINGRVLQESECEKTTGPYSGRGVRGKRLPLSSPPAAAGFPDEFCRITIEDNGIGFDERYLDRIFMPYKRLYARSSQYEGTGMGLTICRKIAEVHGGTVTATSTAGKGSTFIVILPVKAIR